MIDKLNVQAKAEPAVLKPAAARGEDEPLVKMPKGKIIAYMSIVYMLFFMDHATRVMINPMFPAIQKELALTDTQLGFMASAIFAGIAIIVLPISYVADRWSRSKLLSVMAIVWSAGSIVCGLARTFPTLFLSRMSLGCGQSSFAPTGLALIGNWFKKSQWGRVISFWNTAMPMGIFAGSLYGGYMAYHGMWREALVLAGIPGIILGVLALMIPDYRVKSKEADGAAKVKSKMSLKETGRFFYNNKTLLTTAIFYGLYVMCGMSMTAWLPTYLVRTMDFTAFEAGRFYGLVSFGGAFAYILGGFIMDRFYRIDKRSRAWFCGVNVFIYVVLFTIGVLYESLALIAAARLIVCMVPSAAHTISQEVVPFYHRAVSYGILVFTMYLFSIVGPSFTGFLSQNFGIRDALIYSQLACVISAAGFIWTGATYLKDYNRSREEEEKSKLTIG